MFITPPSNKTANLRRLRYAKGLTQPELAGWPGLSVRYLGGMERADGAGGGGRRAGARRIHEEPKEAMPARTGRAGRSPHSAARRSLGRDQIRL